MPATATPSCLGDVEALTRTQLLLPPPPSDPHTSSCNASNHSLSPHLALSPRREVMSPITVSPPTSPSPHLIK
ncbi:hypothetical protein Pmani_025571 [Petrolisthes manimaculis]|uniref:Uncharacterized protein n=1 Tax=Petrolisthes manimaculis TaxID=1843537 RepID=A0AAE1P7N7_9EUCA|nr:hypothetical protein Pmani_025571 [Petrolisthes manimaculis]